MEIGLLVLLLVLVLAVVVLFSPIGLGGGLLYVPIFHYVGGMDLNAAIIASLSVVFCVAAGSGLAHSKERLVDTSRVKEAISFAIPLAILGALLTIWIIDEIDERIVKILAILLTCWVLWSTYVRINSESKGLGDSKYESTPYRTVCGTGGLASGMLGIGGGAMYVTANRNWGGMTVKQAAGTSFIIAMCVQPFAFSSHLIFGSGFQTLVEELGYVTYFALLISTGFVSFNSGKFAIRNLSEILITRIFVFMVSLSLLRYLADVTGLI